MNADRRAGGSHGVDVDVDGSEGVIKRAEVPVKRYCGHELTWGLDPDANPESHTAVAREG